MQFFVWHTICLASLTLVFSVSSYNIRRVRQTHTGIELVSGASLNQSAQLWELHIQPEAYLGPAPVSVALMGQLLVICSKTDISLAERPPLGGYRFIRYPSSLRASLVQLANDAWDAFHDAFRTMSFLQSEMQQLPVHLRNVVRVVKTAPLSIMSNMTGISLRLIRSTGEQAALRARSTADKFGVIMNLTGEISEAVLARKGDYEEKLWNTEVELVQNQVMKNATDRQIQDLEKKQREIDEEVRQADAAYAKAIKDLPTGWKALGLRLGHALTSVVENAGSLLGLANLFKGKQDQPQMATKTDRKVSGPRLPTIDYKEAAEIMDLMSSLKNFINTPAASTVETANDFSRSTKKRLEVLSRNIMSEQAQRIRSLIEHAKGVVDRIKNDAASGDAVTIQEAAELNTAAQNLYAEAVGQQEGAFDTGTAAQPPGDQKGLFANEKLKVFLAMDKANRLAKTQMEIFNSRLSEYRSYYEIIGRLATLDMRTVRFDEIIKMLKEATQVMSALRHHWAKLVQFFDILTQQVDKAVRHSIMPSADQLETVGVVNDAGRDYIASMVVDDANGVLSQVYFLQLMAGMYLDVHNRHINTQLAGLSALATVAPEQQNAKMQALLQQAESAEADIKTRLMQQVAQQQARISDVVAETKRELRQIGETTISA